MRIIAGRHRGRTLRAPKGEATRPTTDRVRESMMSAVASARGGFAGAVVLDAFAGSGALGLEALSRGAARAVFFERAPGALAALQANVRALGYAPPAAAVRRADVLSAPPAGARPAFDLVFLDPPYAYPAAEVLGMVRRLAAGGALAKDAVVVYEHAAAACADVDEAAAACGFSLARRGKYGDTIVDMLRPAPTTERMSDQP